ncbi:MAG: alpha/beta hydrolase [Lachnospiraceae bacterium]|nr:alpha/beta hydrolase [Lachnospiraceae bacterium]
MIKRFTVTFPAPEGNGERTAYIYLPDSYFRSRKKRYPVLYMFDGHNVFFDADATYGKSWGMEDFMKKSKTQLIIAAVECNHSPNNGRLIEYSPFTFFDPSVGHIAGRGRTTMNWFVNVFKRHIDRNYRTIPDREHTFIAGSSMGGLMSIYALLEYNSVFSRAAALSPSLWTAPEKLTYMATQAKLDPDTILYMDYGSEEFNNHAGQRQIFGDFASLLMWRQIPLTCRIVPGGTHCEASWERQIPYFINTLLYTHPITGDK